MQKARILLAVMVIMGAAGAVLATKAKSFKGYIINGGAYSTVIVPFNCDDLGPGCIYTSWNGNTFQVYTLDGTTFRAVRP